MGRMILTSIGNRAWQLAGLASAVTLLLMASTPDAGAAVKIIGGHKAQPGTWRYMAFVEHSAGAGYVDICSGTIVSSNVVLTAGHCAVNESTGRTLPATTFRVHTGSVNWTAGRVNRVSRVIVDPSYDADRGTSDAALLVLAAPVASPRVRLAAASDRSLELPGTPAYIVGWGDTVNGQAALTEVLRWAPTVVQRQGYCAAHAGFPFVYTSAVNLCVLDYPYDDTATCSGDSGGPLIAYDSANRPVEIGVTSYGQANCGTHSPSVFATVRPLRPWVQGWINAVAP
ncbi:MAG: S1 family peptidase [Solirubrobacteraceae bacterium]